MIRAFVAISPGAGTRQRLAAALGGLADEPLLRRVPVRNLHLTLAFLGQISPVQADSATAAVKGVSADLGPFGLRIGGGLLALGARRSIIAVAVKGEVDQLHRMRRRLQDALAENGIAASEQRFRPHMTLARIQRAASARERRVIWQAAESRLATLQVEFRVQNLGLYRSHLESSGARYQLLAQSEFANPHGRLPRIDRCPRG
jgi:2'-5' RNA ligase